MSESPEKLFVQYRTTSDGVGEGWRYTPNKEILYPNEPIVEYIRSDLVESLLEQQREACAGAVDKVIAKHMNEDASVSYFAVMDACRNARIEGKEDEMLEALINLI